MVTYEDNLDRKLDEVVEQLERLEGHLKVVQGALQEWQDARRAIFAYPMKSNPSAEQLALWTRLGQAESRLMGL